MLNQHVSDRHEELMEVQYVCTIIALDCIDTIKVLLLFWPLCICIVALRHVTDTKTDHNLLSKHY